MLKIATGHIRTRQDVLAALQNAIKLEHATIPPYLFALYSIKPHANRYYADAIRDVVVEEMLHMTLAANILNALGGNPIFARADFIPQYPGPLPMGIGSDQHGGLDVPLRKLSPELCETVFKAIEAPEDEINIPVATAFAADRNSALTFDTIGEFYQAIRAKIVSLGNGVFTGNPRRQIVFFPGFPGPIAVSDVVSAVKAIDAIVSDGEGSSTSPIDFTGELAHFYRFSELAKGKKIQEDKSAPDGYSFGEEIPFDQTAIWPVKDNPKIADYTPGTDAHHLAQRFNYTYSKMLVLLEEAFGGSPGRLKAAVSLMVNMKGLACRLMATKLDTGSEHAAPTFEFVATRI